MIKTYIPLRFHSLFRFRSFQLLLTSCLLGILLVSCGDSSTGPDNGEEEPPEPIFSNVLQIFEDHCASCHVGTRTSGVRLDSYDNVLGSVGEQYEEEVIQPGDAAGSPLVDKIESSNPEHGDRMPQGQSPLSSQEITLIKNWIDDGANNN